MTTLKPTSNSLSLIYTCPKCEANHWATVEETTFPGGTICYCGEKIKYLTIQKVDIKIQYEQVAGSSPIKEKSNNNYDKAASILAAQGIDSKYIKQAAGLNQTVETLVREAILNYSKQNEQSECVLQH